MKYCTPIWILLLLLNSCSVKKITQQYLANDDVCFCGLDNMRLDKNKKYDISILDFETKGEKYAMDTLINTENFCTTWKPSTNKAFTIWEFNKNTNIETIKEYYPSGFLKSIISYLRPKNGGIVYLGYYASIFENGKYEWETNENYIISADYHRIDTVAKKYPICWKEATNIVEAKIGKYELLSLYKHFDDEPNYKGMQYYWTVKAKKKWQNPKYYYVDAVTGKVERAIIIATLSTDDML